MSRKITITMTEEVVTTVEVDDHWLADHGLPGNLDTLRSGDYDEELFEVIDGMNQSTVQVAVPERSFDIEEVVSPCQYTPGSNHSDDLVKVLAGRTEPVILCGYHSTWDLTKVLATIPD